MNKLIIKILVIFFIVFNVYFTVKTYALNTSWDFNINSEYTLSNSWTTEVSTWLWRLILNLNHEGTIINWEWWALLNAPEDIAISWNYAFISAWVSDAVEIVDISNPTLPIHVSSISKWWNILLDDPRDIVISWNYAFIAANKSDAIEVIDISNPINPSHAIAINDGWNYLLNWPKWLFISWNYLYVVSDVDDAIQIIDISNPLLPVAIWNLSSNRLDWADQVFVSWNYAYITANKWDSFQVVDVSNPSIPNLVWELTDWTWWALLNWASWIDINWNYAYIASDISDALEIIDISNPLSPTHISSLSNWWLVTLDWAKRVIVDWTYAYITSNLSDAVEVVDISNPYNPVHFSNIIDDTITTLDWANAIIKSWNYLYIWSWIWSASWNGDWLEIISLSYDTNNPYIIPNKQLTYSWSIDLITTTLWIYNEWNITYQISKDNGLTWYYYNWSFWAQTIAWVNESNSEMTINSELPSFNWLAWWTWEFKVKAFLNSNWNQKVEIDNIKIDYTTSVVNEIIDFELPGWYTVTQGVFTRVTTEFYEWTYSIESWNFDNNSVSCFEVNRDILSDSNVTFYKKVSSESGYDFLNFYIDWVLQDGWSWEILWWQETYFIWNWNHTFKWCYEKNLNKLWWLDKAWVDYIEFIPITPPTQIWVLDFEVTWWYTVTSWVWTRVTTEKYEWLYSIESWNFAKNTSSCFNRIQTIWDTEVWIWFYRKISSEPGYDFLIFYIDWIEQDRWSWEVTWEQKTYNLTPWTYTLEWCYTKDWNTDVGQDRAWIDYVTVLTDPPILTEITPIPTPTSDNTPSYTFNSTINWTISYSWWCTSPTSSAIIWDNTITLNPLNDWTYTNCTIQVLAFPQNSTILTISNFTIDTTWLVITHIFPQESNLIPNSTFDIVINYFDSETPVDIWSAVFSLYKWDWISSWWNDISNTYIDFWWSTITETWAIYPLLSKLWFWKYKIIFYIENIAWTPSNSSINFYIDEPELIISTWSVDFWTLETWINNFSPELTITIKTIWAWFDLILNKWTLLNYFWVDILDWNWINWYWYDKTPYTTAINLINTNEIIATQIPNININWEKNTYIYWLKLWAKITEEQAAWNYSWTINFWLNLDY